MCFYHQVWYNFIEEDCSDISAKMGVQYRYLRFYSSMCLKASATDLSTD